MCDELDFHNFILSALDNSGLPGVHVGEPYLEEDQEVISRVFERKIYGINEFG